MYKTEVIHKDTVGKSSQHDELCHEKKKEKEALP